MALDSHTLMGTRAVSNDLGYIILGYFNMSQKFIFPITDALNCIWLSNFIVLIVLKVHLSLQDGNPGLSLSLSLSLSLWGVG